MSESPGTGKLVDKVVAAIVGAGAVEITGLKVCGNCKRRESLRDGTHPGDSCHLTPSRWIERTTP